MGDKVRKPVGSGSLSLLPQAGALCGSSLPRMMFRLWAARDSGRFVLPVEAQRLTAAGADFFGGSQGLLNLPPVLSAQL